MQRYTFAKPFQGDDAKEVYRAVKGRIAKDFENAPAFAQHFEFNEETENINGSSLFYGILINEELSNEIDEIMDEHNESEFWHLLMVRLGQRDFREEAIDKDIKFIEKNHGMLPEKVHKYYKKYGDEFEKYDIDRLKIVK